jgi:membrane-associated phospholipid phosphatase
MRFRSLLVSLSAADLVSILFLLFLTLLNVIFASRVTVWLELVLVNLAFISLIIFLATRAESRKTPLYIGMHRWYLYIVVLLVFKELYFMIRPIHPIDYDQFFIEADRWIFGVDPTVWLYQFAHPVLTEILQIAYSSYYILFLMLGIEIYRRHTLKSFDKAGFLVVYGFFLSYLGYFLLPAIGPRFTLHDFHSLSQELPGLFLTEPLRAFVNFGESVPTNIPNPADVVQRDVFPSGHTQLSLIVAYLGFHFRLSTRWAMAILTGLLIIGTVYLRYHYFVDIIGGVLFFWFTVWSGHHIEIWWLNKRHVLQNE